MLLAGIWAAVNVIAVQIELQNLKATSIMLEVNWKREEGELGLFAIEWYMLTGGLDGENILDFHQRVCMGLWQATEVEYSHS